MRVLILSNLYPNPYQLNRAPFNRQQFRALANEHEVRVIAPIAWTGELSGRHRASDLRQMSADRQRVCDGMIINHPRYTYTPKLLRGWYGRFYVRSVRECFRRVVTDFHPDVVLGCWAYPDGWAAVQLAREAGLPVVVKVQGSDVRMLKGQPGRKRRTVEAVTGADAVVAVSRDLAGHVETMGAEAGRVHVVYNGVDANVFNPGPREAARRHLRIRSSEPLILFVGNLLPVKGPDVLVDAITTVARAGVPFQCAIVGEGPMQAPLQRRIGALGLRGRIKFVGPCPLERLPDWYRAADLVVLPSRSEGVPNVLLEAIACGTPFVASSVGGIPEIASAESLVPPEDPAALAEKIRVALRNTDRSVGEHVSIPRSWTDSARALAAVLQGVVRAAAAPLAKAG